MYDTFCVYNVSVTHLNTHSVEPRASTARRLKCVWTRSVEHRVHADGTGHFCLLCIWTCSLLRSMFTTVGTRIQGMRYKSASVSGNHIKYISQIY